MFPVWIVCIVQDYYFISWHKSVPLNSTQLVLCFISPHLPSIFCDPVQKEWCFACYCTECSVKYCQLSDMLRLPTPLWHWALPEQSFDASAMFKVHSQPTFLLLLMVLMLPHWYCPLSVYMPMSVCMFGCSYRCIIPTRLYSVALISWSKCATVSQ